MASVFPSAREINNTGVVGNIDLNKAFVEQVWGLEFRTPEPRQMLGGPAYHDPKTWRAETRDPQASWLVRIAEIDKLQVPWRNPAPQAYKVERDWRTSTLDPYVHSQACTYIHIHTCSHKQTHACMLHTYTHATNKQANQGDSAKEMASHCTSVWAELSYLWQRQQVNCAVSGDCSLQ